VTQLDASPREEDRPEHAIRPIDSAEPAALTILSPYLGLVSWDPENELMFAAGLPGFEQERRMLPVEIPAHRPLIYLQSLDRSEVCFLMLPVFTIDPNFHLSLSDDERTFLQLEGVPNPVIGVDVLCMALLVPSGHTVETNLNAAIIVNLRNFRCVQMVVAGAAPRICRLAEEGCWVAAC
jgi:flagellar assembly factor FliW